MKNLCKVDRPFIKLPKKKKNRHRLKYITCEYVESGTIGRKPYNQDHSSAEERWKEIAQICSEIIEEYALKKFG